MCVLKLKVTSLPIIACVYVCTCVYNIHTAFFFNWAFRNQVGSWKKFLDQSSKKKKKLALRVYMLGRKTE